MSRTVAGTLLLPDGTPLANASIYLTAKRVEVNSIVTAVSTFFTTNSSGVYSKVVTNGWYNVAIEYLNPSTGSASRRWNLGDIFVDDTAGTVTLNALLIAMTPPDDPNLDIFYDILADAQAAAASASASAAAAAASAATIVPTNSPTDTTPGRLWRTNDLKKTISALDTTAGSVMRVGDFGLGLAVTSVADMTATDVNFARIFRMNAAATGGNGLNIGMIALPTDGTPTMSYLGVALGGAAYIGKKAGATASPTWDLVWSSNIVTGSPDTYRNILGLAIASSPTFTNLSLSGDLSFTGSAKFIKGDFSNATVGNRTIVKTSTVNGATRLTLTPDGTATTCAVEAYNNSNTTNSSAVRVTATSSDVRLESIINGSGSYLPLSIYNGGAARLTMVSSGDISFTNNFSFTGSGARIQGDFGNATFNSRVMFQSNVANGNTSIGALPNGTAVAANYIAFNAQDTTNCAYTQLSVNSTASDLVSGVRGTGTALPLNITVNGATSQAFPTDGSVIFPRGNVYITASSGQSSLFLQQGGTSNGRVYASGGAGTDASLESLRNTSLKAVGDNVFYNALTSFGVGGTQNQIFALNGNAGFGVTTPDTSARIQSANGIKLGNTANANTSVLDWYEEGTFTPTMSGQSTAGSGTYTEQIGRYTRIGNRINFDIRITWTAHTGTGNLIVTGLPFTSNSGAHHCPSMLNNGVVFGSGKTPTAYIPPSATRIELYQTDPAGGSISQIAVDTAGQLIISGHFEV